MVKFKCIGARKDKDSQIVLKTLAQLEKGELDKFEVKMVPKPDNPVDAKACNILGWKVAKNRLCC